MLRFSVGFGKPLWKRTAKDGVEYMVAALPLGGYVKMLDEREGHVDESEYDVAFNRQSVWSRIAIVAAGPIFNLVFAVFAFWLMFMAGIPAMAPIIGETTGLAQEAGIRPHDQIVAVDGNTTETWQHAVLGLLPPALDREEVTVSLEDREGGRRNVVLDLTRLGDDFREEIVLEEIVLQMELWLTEGRLPATFQH